MMAVARSRAPSFCRIEETCDFTVRSVVFSVVAISALVAPAQIESRTCRSRGATRAKARPGTQGDQACVGLAQTGIEAARVAQQDAHEDPEHGADGEVDAARLVDVFAERAREGQPGWPATATGRGDGDGHHAVVSAALAAVALLLRAHRLPTR